MSVGHGEADGLIAAAAVRVATMPFSPLIDEGLKAVFSQAPDMEWISMDRQPDVVVADLQCGLWLSRQAVRGVSPGAPPARILVLANPGRASEVRVALNAGVDGLLDQNCSLQELLGAVRQLVTGTRYLSAAAASHLAECPPHDKLTRRELEVLQLAAQGRSNKAIAQALAISSGTVKVHMRSVMGKLCAASRTEAALMAMEQGLTR